MAYDKVALHYVLKRYTEGTLYDVTLKRTGNEWVLSGSVGGGCVCSDSEAFRLVVPSENVTDILMELTEIEVSPLVLHDHPLEVGFEELSILNGLFSSSFIWNEDAPCGFQKLQRVGNTLRSWIRNRDIRNP